MWQIELIPCCNLSGNILFLMVAWKDTGYNCFPICSLCVMLYFLLLRLNKYKFYFHVFQVYWYLRYNVSAQFNTTVGQHVVSYAIRNLGKCTISIWLSFLRLLVLGYEFIFISYCLHTLQNRTLIMNFKWQGTQRKVSEKEVTPIQA